MLQQKTRQRPMSLVPPGGDGSQEARGEVSRFPSLGERDVGRPHASYRQEELRESLVFQRGGESAHASLASTRTSPGAGKRSELRSR